MIWRLVNLFIAITMLVVSALPPETRLDVRSDIARRTFGANLFHWLFMISLLLYIPFLISGTLLFVVELTAFARNRSGCNAFNLMLFSLVTLVALYRLNDWVFGRIF